MNKFYELTRFIPLLENGPYEEQMASDEKKYKGTIDDPIPLSCPTPTNVVKEFVDAHYNFVTLHQEYNMYNYHDILFKNGIDIDREPFINLNVANVDAKIILALMTAVFQADRIVDGLIISLLENGVMQRWLKRLEEIGEMRSEEIMSASAFDEYCEAKGNRSLKVLAYSIYEELLKVIPDAKLDPVPSMDYVKITSSSIESRAFAFIRFKPDLNLIHFDVDIKTSGNSIEIFPKHPGWSTQRPYYFRVNETHNKSDIVDILYMAYKKADNERNTKKIYWEQGMEYVLHQLETCLNRVFGVSGYKAERNIRSQNEKCVDIFYSNESKRCGMVWPKISRESFIIKLDNELIATLKGKVNLSNVRPDRVGRNLKIEVLGEFNIDDTLNIFNILINHRGDIAAIAKEAQAVEDALSHISLTGKEVDAIVKVRIGQGAYRDGLLQRYKCCCLCGVTNSNLLTASHIKPWRESTSEEKTDLDNGLLLCPDHDRLFDQGYITFGNNGEIIISQSLTNENQALMNIKDGQRIDVREGNKKYLQYHRHNVFKGN